MQKLRGRIRGETTPHLHIPDMPSNDETPRCNSWTGSLGRRPSSTIGLSSSASVPTSTTVASAYETMQSSLSASPREERRQRAGSILQDDRAQQDLLRIVSQTRGDSAPAAPSKPRDLVAQRGDGTRLFEYMCVCGLQRTELPQEPTVLASVPESAEIDKHLAVFVFADHTPVCKPLVVDSAELRLPADSIQTAANSYMLCLCPEAPAPLYVFVMRMWEVFEEPTAWVPPRSIKAGSMVSGRHLTERAYCIVSHNPYAQLFWRLLWQLGAIEHRRITTDDPDRRERQRKRSSAFAAGMRQWAQLVKPPGSELRLENAACWRGPLSYKLPTHSQSLRESLSAIFLPVLLRALSPANITTLMTALITGTRIIVMARDPGRVSACAMALATMMAPFSWQGLLWTLVPHAFTDLLGAPVPYIAGLVSTSSRPPDGIDSRVVTALVDCNRVITSNGSLPVLPCAHILATTLGEICMRMRRGLPVMNGMCEDTRPFDTLDHDKVLCTTSAHEALSSYTVWLIASVRAKMHDPTDTEFTAQAGAHVLAAIDEAHRDFVREMFDTQHWILLTASFDSVDLSESGTGGSAYENETL